MDDDDDDEDEDDDDNDNVDNDDDDDDDDNYDDHNFRIIFEYFFVSEGKKIKLIKLKSNEFQLPRHGTRYDMNTSP